jgi:hypothetical protein
VKTEEVARLSLATTTAKVQSALTCLWGGPWTWNLKLSSTSARAIEKSKSSHFREKFRLLVDMALLTRKAQRAQR